MSTGSIVVLVAAVVVVAAAALLLARGRARRAEARAAEAERAREREEQLGEEVRARLAALTESPPAWQRARDEAARHAARAERDQPSVPRVPRDPWSSRDDTERRPRHGDGHDLGRAG